MALRGAVDRVTVGELPAWWYRHYAKGDRDLEAAEKLARSAGRGLWADKAPVPPWEFRRPRTKKKVPA